jgi:hypothetical protein
MFIERLEKGEKIKEEELKRAFDKVKLDIFSLSKEISDLKSDIIELKSQFKQINESIEDIKLASITSEILKKTQKYPTNIPTNQHIIPTHSVTPTDNPTVPYEVGGLKSPNLDTSIRNRGVPTDRQTDRQTDNPTHFYPFSNNLEQPKTLKQSIIDASEIINSLDSIKKEIRLKFKGMTQQEMLVFSTIFQLEDQFKDGIEYKQIAAKLGLSESSIRDYTQKLISKGIPILKEKVNNKRILLKISSELRNIASLEAIIKLREL